MTNVKCQIANSPHPNPLPSSPLSPPLGEKVRLRGQRAVWPLCLALPLALLIPAYPSLELWWFQWREPTYTVPLQMGGPLVIRKDAYGSGLFGARRSGGRSHKGIDLAAPLETPVRAAKSGRATIGRLKNGLGRYLEIDHPDGWRTLYAHLNRITVEDDRWVWRGESIGSVGKSGNARRRLIQPHLHFEVWNAQGAPVDPLTVMEPEGHE